MKLCIEYKLHRNRNGTLETPSWISDGGYYRNAERSMIGFVPADNERDWYVPDSAVKLTEAQFITRGMAMHNAAPFQKSKGAEMVVMNNNEATAMLRNFYQSKIAE